LNGAQVAVAAKQRGASKIIGIDLNQDKFEIGFCLAIFLVIYIFVCLNTIYTACFPLAILNLEKHHFLAHHTQENNLE